MTSRRWSPLVSGLVLILALAAGGSARAQIELSDVPCIPYPIFNEFSSGYGFGSDAGFSPFDFGYGSFGGTGYGGFGGIDTSSFTGFGQGLGQWSQTNPSLQPYSDTRTSRSGSKVSKRRVRRGRRKNESGTTSRSPAGSSSGRVGSPPR